MKARELLCVLKLPGRAPQMMRLPQGREGVVFRGRMKRRPFDLPFTQEVVFGAEAAASGLPANIVHPTYRGRYELHGPILVFGVDAARQARSLGPIEAQQVVALLGTLAATPRSTPVAIGGAR